MADSMNNFAMVMYKCLSATEKENVFFSPASIYVALSMTYCGARNNTADQMKNILKLCGNPDDKKIHLKLNELWKTMLGSLKEDKAQIEMANSLWIQKSFHVETLFKGILSSCYKSDAFLTDFKSKPEETRKLINAWVADQTNQKIKDLLASGSITELSRLIITNAIYFKGKWVFPFQENNTREMPFHTSVAEYVNVHMMFCKEKFAYTEDRKYDCKVLTLPYVGCQLKMSIILPNKIDGLDSLEENMCRDGINKNNLLKWISSSQVEIKTFIPRFKFAQSCNLNDTLKSLGMTDLFSEDDADLSGISKNDLVVSDVIHKAFVEVNEKGTESAAASAVFMMAPTCIMPPRPVPVFLANHPFMFSIFDSSTKVILFVGRVCKL